MTVRKYLISIAFAGIGAFTIAGCSSSSRGQSPFVIAPSPTPSPVTRIFQMKASLGALVNATCTIDSFPAAPPVLGSATTNAAGVASFNNIPGNGPFIIVCSGGSFFDEGSGQTVALGSGTVSAIVPSSRVMAVPNGGTVTVAVTTASDLAAAAFSRLAPGNQNDTTLLGALQEVATLLGLPRVDVGAILPSTVDGSTRITATQEADIYAAVLAGLSFAGNSLQPPENAAAFLARLRTFIDADQEVPQNLVDAIDAGIRSALQSDVVTDPAIRSALTDLVEAQLGSANATPGRRLVNPLQPVSPAPLPTPSATPTPTPPTGGTGGTGGGGGGGPI